VSAGREAFAARYWGIWNVEGDSGPDPLFASREAAEDELARRRALAGDDWYHMADYHQVFPADIVGAWWNSAEVDPRASVPLSPAEIMLVLEMSSEAGRAVRLPGESGAEATHSLPATISSLCPGYDRVLVRYEERDGACAAYAYARYGSVEQPVPGGVLLIEWEEKAPPVPISVRFVRRGCGVQMPAETAPPLTAREGARRPPDRGTVAHIAKAVGEAADRLERAGNIEGTEALTILGEMLAKLLGHPTEVT
jgi:hypothetical protein